MSTPDSTPADAMDRLRLARTEGVGPVAYRRLLARYGSAAAALAALPASPAPAGAQPPPAIPSPDDAERELHAVEPRSARACCSPASPTTRRCWRCWTTRRRASPSWATPRCCRPARSPSSAAATPRRTASAWRRRWPPTWRAGWWWSPASPAASTPRRTTARCRPATVAAVAGGLDMPYPPEHADLQRRIAEQRRRGHRGAPWHRAPGTPLPAPQPDHRRPVAGRRGGGGGAALRQPDHRAAGAGSRARAVRGAGLAARSPLRAAPTT